MRNEVYQSFPLHFYLGNNEFQMLNSDISNFFRDSQLSNDHQYGNFLPLSTVEFSPTLTSLQNPVLSDATASAPQPRLIQSTSSAPEAKLIGMKNDRKRSVLLEKNFMIEESKKMKAVCEEDPRPCHPIHDPSSDTQEKEKEKEKEKKAPVRRSQKMGDKITALQKLVSPFGKTDTASVLQEAAVFIKYLQEQIEVLSAPYFAARPLCHQLVVGRNSVDLGSRGLCLVPLSYTQSLTKDGQPEHSISRRTIIPRKH